MLYISKRKLLLILFLGFNWLFVWQLFASINDSLPQQHLPKHVRDRIRAPLELRSSALTKTTYLVGEAHVDMRAGNMGQPSVRLLVVSTRRDHLHCTFPDGGRQNASLYEMAENHARPYRVFFLSCLLPIKYHTLTLTAITIGHYNVKRKIIIPISKIGPIFDPPRLTGPFQSNYSICIPFLHGNRYGAENLAETVEFAKLAGAEQIFIYVNYATLSTDLRQLLLYYSDKKIVTAVQYQPPMTNVADLWYFGQLLTITDCLYRNIGVSKLVAFHDFDEFLVPYTQKSLPAAVRPLFAEDDKLAGLRIATQYHGILSDRKPLTLNNVRASSGLDTRLTKCLVKPERVFEQGIHHVSRVIQDNYKVNLLTRNVLLLHHYTGHAPGDANYTRIRDAYGKTLRQSYEDVLAHVLARNTSATG